MTQRLIAVLIVVGLGIGVWVLWPRDDSGPSTTTSPIDAVTTTDGPPAQPTTTPAPGDSTTVPTDDGTHVVETVEEAEEILRDLLIARYVAIQMEDRALMREVVATEQALNDGIAAFGRVEFTAEPNPGSLVLEETRILRSDQQCLVVSAVIDPSAFIAGNATSEGVVVARHADGTWKWMSLWRFEGDLWEADCDALLEPF